MAYDYENFKQDIYKLTNINLSLYKERQMKRRIESLMNRKGYKKFDDYFQAMKQDDTLLRAFVSYLTINVSEFYRNPKQWEVFEAQMIPYLKRKFGTRLNIWSAACSTGDEPYTIAMILAKHFPLDQIHIFATDIDEDVLAFAKKGFYSNRSLERLPREFLKNYFTKDGNGYQINESIRRCVEFRKHNLLEDKYPGAMHMIVCRNVVIYFTEEAKDEVYQKFYQSLVKDGILFIGSTEQIIRAKEIGFGSADSFFYQKI
ncbi:MAG: protein-glutamate O-methyltransferase CheR [Bacteroidales bacterium]|nr:protein-glutamate O-methyltransferase CheR [Clostridium sp.]MCM1203094.1 protein-glutamate O-methyltransferase CheR [Bacteroidales bacterium]